VIQDEFLAVGRVSRAHGVRGEVSVQSLTEVQDRFAVGSVLRLEDGRHLTVQASRPHRHRLLVRFHEVADRTAAEALRGQVLLVEARATPQIDEEDRFWIHEVIGLDVATEEGRPLGKVVEVRANPANDLWVTETGAVIPAVREIVVEVDLEAGRVVIRPVPGLLEEG
jgi:16S rRNA processing protein RimM